MVCHKIGGRPPILSPTIVQFCKVLSRFQIAAHQNDLCRIQQNFAREVNPRGSYPRDQASQAAEPVQASQYQTTQTSRAATSSQTSSHSVARAQLKKNDVVKAEVEVVYVTLISHYLHNDTNCYEAKMKEQSALERMVEPSEIADGIYFLCSAAAKAITGTILPIDAGYLSSTSYKLYAGWTKKSRGV